MERLQRAAILTELMDRLRADGSWCGETHVQKATYFLQEVLGVQTGFEYILYKHGPYSFDLRGPHRAAGRLPHGIQSSVSRLRTRLGSHPDEHGASRRYPRTLGQHRPPD